MVCGKHYHLRKPKQLVVKNFLHSPEDQTERNINDAFEVWYNESVPPELRA